MGLLKPISCHIEGNLSRSEFNLEDLRVYLNNTEDVILWVEDAEGNQAPIYVEFLRENFA